MRTRRILGLLVPAAVAALIGVAGATPASAGTSAVESGLPTVSGPTGSTLLGPAGSTGRPYWHRIPDCGGCYELR